MTETRTPLPLRSDTFFGICQALGDDLGFNPNLLRIALGAGLIFNPILVLGIYFGLGLVVLLSRLAAPDRRRPAEVTAEAPAPATAAGNDADALPEAA